MRFRHLSSVLFPAPDGPMSPKTPPAGISRVTRCRRARAPAATVRSRREKSGSFMGGIVGAQAHGQGGEAEKEDQREQHKRRAPELLGGDGIEGILREIEDMIGQREDRILLDALGKR